MQSNAQQKPTIRNAKHTSHNAYVLHKRAVLARLRSLGANDYDLLLPETRRLPQLLDDDEILFGVVYGRYEQSLPSLIGRGMLAVTNKRIMFIDKKPLLDNYEDISFQSIGGVRYSTAGIGITVTLEVRAGFIKIRTFNSFCAKQFVNAVQDILYAQQRGWQ